MVSQHDTPNLTEITKQGNQGLLAEAPKTIWQEDVVPGFNIGA